MTLLTWLPNPLTKLILLLLLLTFAFVVVWLIILLNNFCWFIGDGKIKWFVWLWLLNTKLLEWLLLELDWYFFNVLWGLLLWWVFYLLLKICWLLLFMLFGLKQVIYCNGVLLLLLLFVGIFNGDNIFIFALFPTRLGFILIYTLNNFYGHVANSYIVILLSFSKCNILLKNTRVTSGNPCVS